MSSGPRSLSIVQNAAAGFASHLLRGQRRPDQPLPDQLLPDQPRRDRLHRGAHPIGQSGFHPSAARKRERVRFAEWPIAEPDCRRILAAGVAAERPASAKLPAAVRARVFQVAKAAGRPIVERPSALRAPAPETPAHRPNSARPSPVLQNPVLPSSARCCPERKTANAAVPARRPGKPKALLPLQWSEVCQSYSSPEQQCCHGTTHIFLRKVTDP